MKSPLLKTITELCPAIDAIRGDLSREATQADGDALEDLARLDEALSRTSESLANTSARLLIRQRTRQAAQP
jgi:hypothetical protein